LSFRPQPERQRRQEEETAFFSQATNVAKIPLPCHPEAAESPAQRATSNEGSLQLCKRTARSGADKTKKAAVTVALAEDVQRRKQLRILEAFGSIDFDPKYDYKAERRRTRA